MRRLEKASFGSLVVGAVVLVGACVEVFYEAPPSMGDEVSVEGIDEKFVVVGVLDDGRYEVEQRRKDVHRPPLCVERNEVRAWEG